MTSICKPITSFGKLLNKLQKRSLISSKLWNEIVQDLYTAYSVYNYINISLQYLLQYQFFYGNIYTLYDLFYEIPFYFSNIQPYPFVPLIKARKGLPLTVDYMNSLINAITQFANKNGIILGKSLNFVQPNQIVTYQKFNDIIYVINQFLTFNFNTYFLLDCDGSKFSNLMNSQSAFLNVLIYNQQYPINFNNTYAKNLIIYSLNPNTYFFGNSIINNLLIGENNAEIGIYDNSFINNFIIYYNNNYIVICGSPNIQNLKIYVNYATISIGICSNFPSISVTSCNSAYSIGYCVICLPTNLMKYCPASGSENYIYIGNIEVDTDYWGFLIGGNTFIGNFKVNIENYGIYINGSVYIQNFEINTNNNLIFFTGNTYVENAVIGLNNNGIGTSDNAYIENLTVNTNTQWIFFNGNTVIENLVIGSNSSIISLTDNTVIKNLTIGTNTGEIWLCNYATIENLTCQKNTGTIKICGNAKIINNNCPSS